MYNTYYIAIQKRFLSKPERDEFRLIKHIKKIIDICYVHETTKKWRGIEVAITRRS